MAYDLELADRIREQLATEKKITEREGFGGITFMAAGNMICGVNKDTLIVRVGPLLHHDALTRPHTTEMDFTGRPMKGFVTVLPEGTADDAELNLWVRLGLAYARSLPAKKATTKKAANKKTAAKKR